MLFWKCEPAIHHCHLKFWGVWNASFLLSQVPMASKYVWLVTTFPHNWKNFSVKIKDFLKQQLYLKFCVHVWCQKSYLGSHRYKAYILPPNWTLNLLIFNSIGWRGYLRNYWEGSESNSGDTGQLNQGIQCVSPVVLGTTRAAL